MTSIRFCSVASLRGSGFEPRSDVLASLRATSLVRIGPARSSLRSSLIAGRFAPRSRLRGLTPFDLALRGTGFEPADPYGTAS